MLNPKETRDVVRERYGSIAQAGTSCCGGSVGGSGGGSAEGPSLEELGYTAEQAAAVPQGSNLGLGCGNPLAFAAVQPGETVLDLGSGAGIDAFLAARQVGPTGHVIGVDMTPAMIEKARANAEQVGVTNAEFRLGEIERLPLDDASVDLIISNCVINLSPEKDQVFRETYRVLKPGGRMLVSDLVWLAPPPAEVRESIEALVGCVAGASLKDEYLALMRAAGFTHVEVVAQDSYGSESGVAGSAPSAGGGTSCCGGGGCGDDGHAHGVVSVKVRAVKPDGGR